MQSACPLQRSIVCLNKVLRSVGRTGNSLTDNLNVGRNECHDLANRPLRVTIGAIRPQGVTRYVTS